MGASQSSTRALVSSEMMYSLLPVQIEGMSGCSCCGNIESDWCHELTLDDGSPFKVCKRCDQAFGYDDVAQAQVKEVTREKLASSQIFPCGCENQDQLEIREDYVKCHLCGKKKFLCGRRAETGGWQVSCTKCNNLDPGRFIPHEEDGKLVGAECLQCGNLQGQFTTSAGKSTPYQKELIKDCSKIKRGDHVAWCRKWKAWYHHAMVLSVREKTVQGRLSYTVRVIEYSGPSENGHSLLEKAKQGLVRYRDVDLDVDTDNLYRYNYDCVFSVEEAIQRAEGRLDESSYAFITNNCEHFVRWCKTGESSCTQVKSFKTKMKELGKSFAGYLSGKVVRTIAAAAARDMAAEVATETFEIFFRKAATAFEVIGVVLVLCLELYNIWRNYKKNKADLESGKIDKHEYINRMYRDVSICVGRGTFCALFGFATGALLAFLLPGVGLVGIIGIGIASLVASFLGAKAGAAAGFYVGHRISQRRDEKRPIKKE